MASLNLKGPWELSNENINKEFPDIKPGNYALGNKVKDGFIVHYVGRSDENLNHRLHDWIGQYEWFKASYANSVDEAYKKECQNYHDFGECEKLANKDHPDKPDGSMICCPVCRK